MAPKSTTTSKNDDSNNSTTIIIAVVVAVIFLIIISGALGYTVYKKRQMGGMPGLQKVKSFMNPGYGQIEEAPVRIYLCSPRLFIN